MINAALPPLPIQAAGGAARHHHPRPAGCRHAGPAQEAPHVVAAVPAAVGGGPGYPDRGTGEEGERQERTLMGGSTLDEARVWRPEDGPTKPDTSHQLVKTLTLISSGGGGGLLNSFHPKRNGHEIDLVSRCVAFRPEFNDG